MRATGKTYRAILRSVEMMSAGKDISLVIHRGSEPYTLDIILSIIAPIQHITKYTMRDRTFRVEGAGSLEIVSANRFASEVQNCRYHGRSKSTWRVVLDCPAPPPEVMEFLKYKGAI